MRFVSLWSAALCFTLLTAGGAGAQAGRYIPIPRAPGGAGSWHFLPHPHFDGSGIPSEVIWIIGAMVLLIVAVIAGWQLGRILGTRSSAGQPVAAGPLPAAAPVSPPNVPPLQDLILQPGEVAEKAEKTTRLLEQLAQTDAAFDPSVLREFVSTTFARVQQAWEFRDYDPVRHLFAPRLLATHEALLLLMRRNREINRIDGLRVSRLEFVHVCCPERAELASVAALITFEAKVFFVHEGDGTFLRGSDKVIPYQEFWTFARQDAGWQLQAIDQSHEADWLEAPNRVEGILYSATS